MIISSNIAPFNAELPLSRPQKHRATTTKSTEDFKKASSNGVLNGAETKKNAEESHKKAAKLSVILSGVFVKQA